MYISYQVKRKINNILSFQFLIFFPKEIIHLDLHAIRELQGTPNGFFNF